MAAGWEQRLRDRVRLAQSHGFDLNLEKARNWLDQTQRGDYKALAVNVELGIGARAALLELTKTEALTLARHVAAITQPRSAAVPGVWVAVAVSGSSAQSRINTFPGDLDLFGRLIISRPSRGEAMAALAELVRDMALRANTESGRGEFSYDLVDTHFGTDGRNRPYAWSKAEVKAGYKTTPEGTIRWTDPNLRHVFVKTNWIFVSHSDGRVLDVDVMLDPIWMRPGGELESLDGELDYFFQEVYLEARQRDLLRLQEIQSATPDAVERQYIDTMRREVRKYSKKKNFGKVARRLYNLTRVECRMVDAAYLGELFDEPEMRLYLVGSRLRAIKKLVKYTALPAQHAVDVLRRLKREVEGITGLNSVDRALLIELLGAAETALAGGSKAWKADLKRAQELAFVLVSDWAEPKVRAVPGLIGRD